MEEYALDKLPRAASVQVVRGLAADLSDEDADALASACRDSPLLLTINARILRDGRSSLAQLRAALTQRGAVGVAEDAGEMVRG